MSGTTADDGATPPERLWGLATWLVGHVAGDSRRIINQAFGNSTGRTDLAVLAGLDQYGPISQARLGRRLGISLSEMVSVLRRLESDGAVARGEDPGDRRRNTIAITDSGRETLDHLAARALTAQEELLEPLSAGQRDQLVDILQTLVEHHHDYGRAPADVDTGTRPARGGT